MSVASVAMKRSIDMIENIQSFFRLSISYFKRNNPFIALYLTVRMSIINLLTANKKLKMARYRVNHYRYRLYQMEQLIEENNSKGHFNGNHINQLR
jgi:uncharacterized LabA/DUF88 family protein